MMSGANLNIERLIYFNLQATQAARKEEDQTDGKTGY
jgi:hypothetical protein